MRLHRDGAGWPQFQPKRRQCRDGAGALQWDRAASLDPLYPRALLEGAVVADAGLCGGDLIGDGLLDQWFDLGRNVEARAGH